MTIAEEIRLEGRLEGRLEELVGAILSLLEARFGESHLDTVREEVSRSRSVDHLRALLLHAARASSMEEFLSHLN